MRFTKGTRVEVLNRREVLSSSWWPAEIVSGNGLTYFVRYGRYYGDMGSAVERVSRKAIRPCPPPMEGPDSLVAGDIVEVFSSRSWKLAQVSRMDGGDHFLVRHLGSSNEFRAHISDIRVRQTWRGNKWVVIFKDCGGKFGDRKTSKLPKKEGGLICRKAQLHFPQISDIKKRPRVFSGADETGASRKIRAIEIGGTYNGRVAGSSELLHEKVDAVVSPRKLLGEKYVHASLNNRTGLPVTRQWEEIPNAVHNSYRRSRLECHDTESVSSSVGSCSAINSPYRPPHCVDGLTPDLDRSSNDFVSSSWSGRELSFLSKEALAENIHQLELSAYRSTMVALYASGPISWDQESMMTNLRLMLHISNDEHLSELRNLISVERHASFR